MIKKNKKKNVLARLIIAKQTDDFGSLRISKLFKTPVSAWSQNQKGKEHNYVKNWPRSGAASKISCRGEKIIIR